MSNKTITIIEFNSFGCKDHMYFETRLRAERYLKGNGYESDDIFEWKKDYAHSAKIHMETLHLGDGEEFRIIQKNKNKNE